MIFGYPHLALSLTDLVASFEGDFIGSVQQLGWLALRGIAAWILVAIPAAYGLTFLMKRLVRRLEASVRAGKGRA